MKELSIEEKAKAYDIALDKIKRLLGTGSNCSREELEYVFPELRESEGERIRKEIIDLIKEVVEDDSYHVYGFDKMIDWLEKQSKKDEEILVLKDQIESLHAAIKAIKETHRIELDKEHNICDTCDEKCGYANHCPMKLIEKLKPTDKVEPKFKVGDKIKLAKEPKYPAREIIAIKNDAYYFDELVHLPLRGQDEWELVEQKPAEKWYDFIRWFVKQRTDDYTLIPSDDDIHKWGDNILNHARKVLEQNTAEWSEEDERIYQSIMDDTVQENQLNGKQTDWLRDIKYRHFSQPQNRWKPSKEQMEAMQVFLEHGCAAPDREASLAEKVLESLYQDLKKLREE